MGLTKNSVGYGAVDSGLFIKKRSDSDKVIALAGNPNVGKSTVFNALTGLNQHTGNWPGKTVANAQGYCSTEKHGCVLVDIPGTYSLMAHSAEEEVARNFICFGKPDAVVVVCDATALERNLNLVLQTMEISDRVVVCVNLMDEAARKGINIDLKKLSLTLGVPVVGTSARKKKTLGSLLDAIDCVLDKKTDLDFEINYPDTVKKAVNIIENETRRIAKNRRTAKWLALKLLENDPSLIKELAEFTGEKFLTDPALFSARQQAENLLYENGITPDMLKDIIVSSLVEYAEEIAKQTVTYKNPKYAAFDRRIDRFLTGKLTGYAVMIALLALVFWLTVTGANYPSEILSEFFGKIEVRLDGLFIRLNSPDWLRGALVSGVWRVLSWVVSVMLPPMAIFFPLFTLLEDSGYLPRIAYNLDRPFKKCNACGKQALTVCMGFGCNAAGIVGCRIIDSKRERLLAILTNNFVPCNGRFPLLISVITMFFIGTSSGAVSSFLAAALLTGAIVLSLAVSMLVTKLLSLTLLKGVPSSYTLELPPYRRPQIGKVIVRSVFDRTLFVLGRAAAVAAPAGLIIWITANVFINGQSILSIMSSALDPIGRFMGLDGVILVAFILGFPANETVIPLMIMAYAASGTLTDSAGLAETFNLFVSNGWTPVTAVNVILFSLMHWPCSTTLITIKKETGSIKWTALSVIIPTLCGAILCILVNLISKLVL
ncbi:MAG: ferrous iron transport protein B [Clostridia bacterium]|nr:ferrous iron transport protein B [Clostridia bacterium]